jgi:hypothetical protein
MSTQHTPGPWQILPEESDKPYIRIRGTVLGGRYKVANVNLDVIFRDEARANVHLIAAAPDLLGALKLAVRQNSHEMVMTGEELRKCEAAIDKATGEKS